MPPDHFSISPEEFMRDFTPAPKGPVKNPREQEPSSHLLRVPDAVNPYHDALAEGGLTDPTKNPEHMDRTIDLVKTVEESASLYRANQLTAWETSAVSADLSLLTPEKRGEIESLVKDGWDVIAVLPGKAEQLQNLKEALTKLKPLWIKDSTQETLAATYLWDHYTALIDAKANELTKDVPDRPYILLTEPTQKPPDWTTNKTLVQQQTAYTEYRRTHPTHHTMNPAEYAALQARYTRHLQDTATKAGHTLATIDPLDNATWTRFIDLPKDAGGDVPNAYWNPGDRQLRFGGWDADFRHPWCGFRLAVRVEI